MILESLVLMTSYLFVGCCEKTEDEEELNMKSYNSEDINSQDKLDKAFSESKNKCIILDGFMIFTPGENYTIKYLGNSESEICKI